MRTSPCCGAPTAIHGARRRICRRCRTAWTIRPRQRGRKRKRVREKLAVSLLREKPSLRGRAASCNIPRETFRRRIRASLRVWKKHHPLPDIPDGPLIAVLDALWFRFRKAGVITRYTCYQVLLRPVSAECATLSRLTLLPGKESKVGWQAIIASLPEEAQERIVAVVMDGNSGVMRLAKQRGWRFQWCHAHMKRKVWELRGVRKLPAREIRRQITHLVYLFLETPSENAAQRYLCELRALFTHPDCPQSFPRRLSGLLKRTNLLRAYRLFPELNLPVTTNSAEQIHSQIRERWSAWRGVRTPQALAYWLDIFQREIRQVACRGFKNNFRYDHHRISGS